MGLISAAGAAAIVLYLCFQIFASLQCRRYRARLVKARGCEEPPWYPHKDPLFGLDLFLDALRAFQKFRFLPNLKAKFDRHGQTFQALVMGKVSYFTNDPRNFQAIHASNFKDFGVQPIRLEATLPFLGNGVLNTDGAFWEHSRMLLKPTFTRQNVANLPAFEQHFEKFLQLLPRDGSSVDLKPLLHRLFLDTSTEFLFGESMNSLSPETPFETTQFLKSFHYAQKGMGLRIQMGRLGFLYRDQEWTDSIRAAHAFADKYVDRALDYRRRYLEKSEEDGQSEDEHDSPHKRYVLLNEIAKESGDRLELRNQIIHVFLAGHDSTAIAIGNALFHLCRNPEKWNKLREEILAHGQRKLTLEALKGFRYLQHIIRETLRLHPVAPTDSRIAYRDIVLPSGGGPDGTSPMLVSAGQTVIFSTHALHRRPEYWGADAETFRPERWETCHPGWHYQPFGGGPRMCPGQNLALTEVAYVIARMAQEWKECKCRDDVMEWVEDMKGTASSKNGVRVGLVPA